MGVTRSSPLLRFLIVIAVGLTPSLGCWASSPVVSGVWASQAIGTKLVDIYFNLSDADGDPQTVSVAVTVNGSSIPASSFTGHIGSGVLPGPNRHIVWNAGADWDGRNSGAVCFSIAARDQVLPSGMMVIPSGTFQMGNCMGSSEGRGDEMPVHPVYVGEFCMDKYDVTKSLWDGVYAWAVKHGYGFENTPGAKWEVDGDGNGLLNSDEDLNGNGIADGQEDRNSDGMADGLLNNQYPLWHLNWYDCVKWCNARSEKEGRIPAYYTSAARTTVYRTGRLDLGDEWVRWESGYRLPTEAEWEKAARGGAVGRRFPWNSVDTIQHVRANYSSDDAYAFDSSPTRGYHPSYNTGGFPFTSPVGSFAANGYGLYDMAGNVWQWCWDWHGYYQASASSDPKGPASGVMRVCRGGGWYDPGDSCRAAARGRVEPWRQAYIGFRVVRGGGRAAVSGHVAVDTRALLSPPTGVKATKTLSDRITVTWNGVGASGYEVYRSTGNDPSHLLSAVATVTSTSYPDFFAVAGVSYYYWVKSRDSAGHSSGFSSPAATGLRATLAPPPAPTGLQATTGELDRIVIAWNPVASAEGYRIVVHALTLPQESDEVFYEGRLASRFDYRTTRYLNQLVDFRVSAYNSAGTGSSARVQGYATGRSNANVVWDLARVTALYQDPEPLRVVQVIDTGNTRLVADRPTAVRAYLRTAADGDNPVYVNARLYEGSTLLGETNSYVFPPGYFDDWSYGAFWWSEQFVHRGTPVTKGFLMREGCDSVVMCADGSYRPSEGLHELRVEIRTNGTLVLQRPIQACFYKPRCGMTIVKVPVYVLFSGSGVVQGPDGDVYRHALDFSRAIYPMTAFTEVDLGALPGIPTIMCEVSPNQALSMLNVMKDVLFAAYNHTATLAAIVAGTVRGDVVRVVGIVPNLHRLIGQAGYVYPYSQGVVAESASSLGQTIAHEIGHGDPFFLDDTYTGDGGSQDQGKVPVGELYGGRSEGSGAFNPSPGNDASIVGDADGVWITPNAGAMNLVYSNDRSAWHAYDGEAKVFRCGYPVIDAYNSVLTFKALFGGFMGRASDEMWAEPNEYRRLCDAVLPSAPGGMRVGGTTVDALSASILTAGSQDVAVVIGFVSTNHAAISSISRVSVSNGMPRNPFGRYFVRTRDAASNEIDRAYFSSVCEGDDAGFPDGSPSCPFAVLVSIPGHARFIDVCSSNGSVLTTSDQSGELPVLSSLVVSTNSGVLVLAWDSVGTGSGLCMCSVAYSSGRGSPFQTILTGLTNTSATIPLASLPGGTDSVVSVTVSDGFRSTSITSAPFRVNNSAPSSAIKSPSNGMWTAMGSVVFLSGEGRDLEDGDLPDAAFSWYCDGLPLAVGRNASYPFGSEGHHAVALRVCDYDGNATTTEAQVVVFDPAVTPTADAGVGGLATPGQTVQLDGSGSCDPQSNALFYCWHQVAGTNAPLSDSNSVLPTFTMPDIPLEDSLTYELIVSSGSRTGRPDRVTVTHVPPGIAVAPSLVTFPVSGGSTTVAVTATSVRTPWVVGNSNGWISVSSGAGTGNGTVTLSVGSNSTAGGRSAAVAIGDQVVLVQQDYDSDGDGIPDSCETLLGFNPHDPTDAALDADGDGLSNLAEYHAGANPTNRDSDGDSLPDGWEIRAGLNPNDIREGLHALEAVVPTHGSAQGLCLQSGLAYVADGTNGLLIVDVGVSTNPVIVGGCALTGMACDVSVEGDRACVALGTNGLALIDTTDPANPIFLTTSSVPGTSMGVRLVRGYACVAAGAGGLVMLDATSPERFASSGVSCAVGQAMDVCVVSNLAYVAAGTNGLIIVDISDATNPVMLAHCPTPDVALGVCVVSNMAFVVSWMAGIHVVDVRDAASPVVVGSCGSPSHSRRACADGRFVYVADGGSGIEIIDPGCASNPLVRGTCSTAAWVQDVAAGSGFVYAAVSEAGLQIFRIAGLDMNQNGIPDDWEQATLQGLMSAADSDTDGDGISDWGEYIAGLNPTNSDQDADGMLDGWEVQGMLDPRVNDANGDQDGDGSSNVAEFRAGTDPNNSSSYLGMKGVVSQTDGQGVVVHWSSVAGRFYLLDRSSNLMGSPPFLTVGTNIVGHAGTTSYTDTNAVGSGPFYYRVFLK